MSSVSNMVGASGVRMCRHGDVVCMVLIKLWPSGGDRAAGSSGP